MRKDYSKLIDEIQKKFETASEISIKSGIPESRIRNWLQRKAQPRKEDADILEDLLKGTSKKKAPDVEASDYVANKILKIDATVEVLIEAVGELLARSASVPVVGVVSGLKQIILEREQAKRDELK